MVALHASSDAVAAVSDALDAAEKGDFSLHRRLVLVLSLRRSVTRRRSIGALTGTVAEATDPMAPPTPTQLLTALTHFCAGLSMNVRRQNALRELLCAACNLDFVSHAPSSADDAEPSPDSALVEAYADFAFNAASADSANVELLLEVFARRHFVLPLPRFGAVLDATHSVIEKIIGSYSHAETLLARVVAERYPHPVRKEVEHVFYARAVLRVASYTRSQQLAALLISTVVEKMTIIDAMVADSFGLSNLVECERGSPVSPAASMGAVLDAEESALEKEKEEVVDLDASKMDAVLMEFIAFAMTSLARSARQESSSRMKAIVGSFERFVLPAQGAKHAPFLLFFAVSAVGRNRVLVTLERFRGMFFDPEEAHSIRIAYLYYSAALVARSRAVKVEDVLLWVSQMSMFVHGYVDSLHKRPSIDIEEHQAFYAAVFAIMSVVAIRRDVFDPSVGGDGDAAHRFRLLRLMSCSLNPMLVMPARLVDEFCRALVLTIDFEEIRTQNRTRTLPSRTRYGGVNRFVGFLPLGPCVLPNSSKQIRRIYRSGVTFDDSFGKGAGSESQSRDGLKRSISCLAMGRSEEDVEPVAKRRRADI